MSFGVGFATLQTLLILFRVTELPVNHVSILSAIIAAVSFTTYFLIDFGKSGIIRQNTLPIFPQR
jgi:hypothetical protein